MPSDTVPDAGAILAEMFPQSTHHETHMSHVFVTDDAAYKVKKAVRLPFLDLRDIEERHRCCLMELAANRRFARSLYLGVDPLVASSDGWRLGGEGKVVDWVVRMRAFGAGNRLDELTLQGAVPDEELRQLVDDIYLVQETGGPLPEGRWDERVLSTLADCAEALVGAVSGSDERERVRYWETACRLSLRKQAGLLRLRGETGHVRSCHGDLHAGNVCRLDGRLMPYDALEFSPDLARIDRLYDLAFLIMDLCHLGARQQANLVMNRFLGLTDDYEAAVLIAPYMSLRAGIRAMVRLMGGDVAAGQAYLDTALAALRGAEKPLRLLIGGRSGTGKTTLARRIAGEVPPLPGAVHVRSDVVRKRLSGVMPEAPLPAAAYTPGAANAVYSRVERAFDTLAGTVPVIADATFSGRGEGFIGSELTRVWLTAEEAVLAARLGGRGKDASDADAAVMRSQPEAVPCDAWRVVRTDDGEAEALSALRRAIGPAAYRLQAFS